MSDSATPRTSPDGSPVRKPFVSTGGMLFAHLAAGLIVIGVLGFVVPRFVRILTEFEAEVPPTAERLIAVSNVVAHTWYLLLPIGLAVDAAVLFGLGRLPRPARWLATAWATVVLLAALLLVGLTVAAVIVPLQDLITQLS
ncbi:MAG TPA: hypothetical protein VMY37_38190 [Thermoguttaceae bacterium]|nr:hypothetical protein [Thermoguttaceae bacterium]